MGCSVYSCKELNPAYTNEELRGGPQATDEIRGGADIEISALWDLCKEPI